MKKDEKTAEKAYDTMATFYHKMRYENNGMFFNGCIEMPGMLKMLGNVKGKKILDWGCGSGIYAKLLTKKGAKVKGFDISKEMIDIAKDANPKLDLKVGSGNKIPFNETFDIVYASLAIHYLDDWNKSLKEINRVLKKGGEFIFSIGNPIHNASKGTIIKGKEYRILGMKDYYAGDKSTADWKLPNGKVSHIETYNKPYGEIIRTLVKHNFEIIDYDDPKPISKAKKINPKEYEYYRKAPIFSIWKVRKK